MAKYKEADVAKRVVTYLENSGWEVYQEVPFRGSRADIVATNGKLIKVVEVKVGANLTLLGQAIGWLGYANWVYVAVPKVKGGPLYRGLITFLQYKNIGLYEVNMKHDTMGVHESLSPKPLRRIDSGFFEVLKGFPKNYVDAGTNGQYWTPFKGTIEHVKRYLRSNPNSLMKDVVKSIEHHYCNDSSAKACICKYIREGVIDGIERAGRGKNVRYSLKEDEF